MKRLRNLITGSILLITAAAFASEIDLLTDKLAEKGVITYGEAQQIKTETKEEVRKQIAKGEEAILPGWIQNLSMKGDVRLRQQVDWNPAVNFPRTRERLRLRVGFDTRFIESLRAGFGIATGGETMAAFNDDVIDKEPVSTNHTFNNGFQKARLMVDYVYLEYLPCSWMTITGGKMKSGKQVWNTTDLLWDTDINPDGIALNVSKDFTPAINVFFNGGWFLFNELNSATASNPYANDPDAYIAQPGITWQALSTLSIKTAVAYQQFNVSGKNTGYYGTPAFDYKCINPSVEIALADILGGYTVNIFADTVANGDSRPTSDKSGNAYGVGFGIPKIIKFGDWHVKYLQRRLEANAWLNRLGDSDALGGAVNSGGYEAMVTIGLTPTASLGLDYYSMDSINDATATTRRSLIQADIVYKF